MKLHVKIVLTTIVTLLLLIYLAGFLPVFSQPPTNWVITGRVIGPGFENTEDIASWIPVTNAIVTLTDIQGEIHIVATGEDGSYFFKNLAVDANCVITAIAIVNGKTMVLKDVIPEAVAAPKTYDAGTADAESTALALIVEELTKQGLIDEDIDLEIIQESDNFEIVGEQVLSVLEDNGNIMEEIIVAGEEVDSEEVLEETGDDASDFTVADEAKDTAYKVTVTLREKISDDDPSAGTTAQTVRDTYNINASFIGSGTIEPLGAVTVNNGSSQTFTITSDLNYHILGISIDGNLEAGTFISPYEYTFDNVTDDHTIEAYLAIDTYAIAVIIGNGGSISPSGAVSVNHDSSQTFTITPDLNYHIDDVLIDGSSVGAISSYAFDNVTEDGHTISATFAIDTYTLNMTTDADGTGSGTVNPAEGVHIYDYGDVVIISATEDPGSTFTGWTGDADSETSDVTLTITENKDITASFTLNTYTLTVNTVGNGAGTVTIDPVQENYDHGDVVIISTTADAISSDFIGWAGDNSDDLIENDDGTYSITMDSNKSVIPTFNLKKVTLTVDVAGTGSGTVSPTVGVHTYNYGELVTIGAKPDTGYFGTWIATEDMIGSIFTGWSGDASGTSDLILTMDSDKSVIANFAKKRIVTLTVTATGSGSGTVIPPVGIYTYNYGDVVDIGATPDTASGTWVSSKEDLGSVFTGWDGDASGTGDVTLTMDSDKSVTATFTLEKAKLTMAVTGTGSGTVSPTAGLHTYDYGETITIKATADASSVFTGWSGDASGTGDVTLTMDSAKSVITTFTLKTYTITATTGSNGSISPSGNQIVDYGSSKTFAITPTTGYHIADVVVDGKSKGAVSSYTFNNVTADHTIEATFNPTAVSFAVITENLGTETAGTAFSVTIIAKDIEGNTATVYTGSHNIIWSWNASNSPNDTPPTMAAYGDQTFSNGAVTVTGFILTNSGETPAITATVGSVSGTTAPVTVTAGVLNSITITPTSADVVAGENQTFSAQGYDQYNNEISGLTYTWSVIAGGGSIDSGLFTAGTTAGTTATVEAESSPVSATATVTVTTGILDQFTFAYIDFAVSGTKEEGKPAKTKPFFITIYAKDASENTVTGYTGTGTLTLIDGNGATITGTEIKKVPIVIYDKAGITVNFSDGDYAVNGVWERQVVIGASSANFLGLVKGDPQAFVRIKIATDNGTTGVSNEFIVTD